MSDFAAYFRAMRYWGPSAPRTISDRRNWTISSHFLFSGLCLAALIPWWYLWVVFGRYLDPESKVTHEILGFPGLSIMLGGLLWLFLTGFAKRGAMLQERDHRIAELGTQLQKSNQRLAVFEQNMKTT